MDIKRYSEVMVDNKDTVFDLHLSAWDVGMLNTAVGLILASPEVHVQYSKKFSEMLRDLRRHCAAHFQRMGFTTEEIDFLTYEED